MKKLCSCEGPCRRIARWITPKAAISRRVERGAKLKCKIASLNEIPRSFKNFFNTSSRGYNIEVEAWENAGERDSIKERIWVLNILINSAELKKRLVRKIDLSFHEALITHSWTAIFIINWQSNSTPKSLNSKAVGSIFEIIWRLSFPASNSTRFARPQAWSSR